MKILKFIAWILLIVGGLNWGLVGLFDYNLVESILGDGGLTRTVYALVGLSALIAVFGMKRCKSCKVEHPTPQGVNDQ